MKKIIIFLMLLVIPIGFLINTNTYSFYNSFKNIENCTFCYIFDKTKAERLNLSVDNKLITNGSKEFVYSKTELNCDIKPEYIQVEFKSDYALLKKIFQKLNAIEVFQEEVNQTKVIFFYTPYWNDYKIVKNKKVNIQIAINEDITKIGYPMIYGSF